MHLPDPDPDDLILRLLAEGDARAIDQLYAVYYERLFFVVRKYIRDKHAAATLVNDLLIYIWKKHDKLRLRKPLLYYLYRAVRNRIINFYRDKGRSREIPTPDELLKELIESRASPADEVLLTDDLMMLWTLAEVHMTYRVRQTFIMSRQDGKTKEEISEIMGITVNAVEKNLARAWKVIEKIQKHYFTLLAAALILC